MNPKCTNQETKLSLWRKPVGVAVLSLGLTFAGSAICAPQMHAAPAASAVSAPVQTVSGTVISNENEPLIGVTVTVKGTNKVAVTDTDGRYSIKCSSGDVLEFAYVGFTTQDVKVGSSATIDVVLQENTTLSEVVVIGYGVVRKADMAGSVSVVDSKSFKDQPITEVSEALQGRVSGVNVISDGTPGGTVKIRIRGSNSINKSNEPLYVVDGLVRESGLTGINTEDIASMQVLKDASSTAIYGSRGANGVIIITTKTGKVGQQSITLDASVGVSTATRLPKEMNAQEYAQALVKYRGINESLLTNYLNGTDSGTDWQDEVFGTGVTQNYKVVFTKGLQGLQTYVSGNYMKHEGIVKGSSYERFAARANLKGDVAKWLNVSVDVNASHGVGRGSGGMSLGANALWSTFNYSPTMAIMTEDGYYAKDAYNSIQDNPIGQISSPSKRVSDIFNGHIDLRFNILDGLTFTSSNGVDYYNRYNYSQTLRISNPDTKPSNMSNSNTNRWLLQSSNNLTYVHDWDKVHNLTATAVWEATRSYTKAMSISGTNLKTESVSWWDVNNAASIAASNSYSEWSLLSAVGRVIYSYNNRYMFTGTFRADGSSRLSNNKWAYFPSIAAAWTISNEDFMADIRPTLNNLKLRASWGIIGNQDIDPYSTLAMMSATSTYFDTTTATTGYWANQIVDANLKWEKTKQFDVGIDAGFLNNRVDVSLDWYYKRTSDALLQTSLANYLGGSSYYINAGEVSNTGIDFSLNAGIIETKDFSWNTGFNLSYMKNRVEKMTALEPIIYAENMASIINQFAIVKEGEAIGSLYGYRWAGLDADGYDTYYTADGGTSRTPSADDRVVIGKSTPDVTFGWNNSLRYKNWSLNAFFNAQFGADRLNALRWAMNTITGNSYFVTDASWLSELGKTIADPSKTTNNQCMAESTKWLEKADYFRCENVTLAYDFNKAVTRFADIRLSLSVQNLFTITGYKGSNPSNYNFHSSADWKSGVDMGGMPCPRTVTFGARFTF
jgi:TonB-linked SusC/RagA family outer membrane protein